MYHVELREFPHNTHAFNLDSARLQATVLDPWLAGEVFELGGREWVPQRTTLTILEGAELPLNRLGMGRGWNNALRASKDVTAALLDAARQVAGPASTKAARADRRFSEIERDILTRCAVGPLTLPAVWDRAELAAPDASAGERLLLAEVALKHLLGEQRVELCRGAEPHAAALPPDEADAILRAREAWSTERAAGLLVRAVR